MSSHCQVVSSLVDDTILSSWYHLYLRNIIQFVHLRRHLLVGFGKLLFFLLELHSCFVVVVLHYFTFVYFEFVHSCDQRYYR